MKERKRTLSALCACLAISLGAVACGGSDGTGSQDLPAEPSAAPTTPTTQPEIGPRPGAKYVGPIDGEPGLAGTVTLVVGDSGDEITELMLDLEMDDYSCGGSTISGGLGLGTGFPVAIENDAFQVSGGTVTWAGTFESATRAVGTVEGSLPTGSGLSPCEFGPFSWTAEPGGSADEPDSSPSSTATPPPAPAPAASVDFEEQFDGRLEDGWRWSIEDPGTWSLAAAPGWLQITAVEFLQNVLLRPAPDADYEVTTAVSFRPTSNFQFAGLVAAPRGGQTVTLLQLGRAYCDPLAIPGICVGDGVYFDKIEDGETVNSIVSEISTDTEVLYLRLLADGDSYSGYFSEDGEIWTPVGNQVASYTDTDIGLIAHQAYEEPAAASFDYLTVTSPPVGDKPPAATGLPGRAPAASDADAPTTTTELGPQEVSYLSVADHIGETVTVCGKVATQINDLDDTWLSIGDVPAQGGFLVWFPDPATADAAMARDGVEAYYAEDVCVVGEVVEIEGRPILVIQDVEQVELAS